MAMKIVLLIALPLIAADPIPYPLPEGLVGLNPFSPSGHIVGGKEVNIEEVPYQVSLQVSGFGFCGGSIISSEWVVTAGHCMSYPQDWITVRAGTSRKSNGGTLHKVAKIVKHEKYKTNRYGVPENDIALIKVGSPFKLDQSRQPIPLFKVQEESAPGASATITGWGAIREGSTTSETLRIVSIPIISKQVCSKAYASFGGLPQGQICAAYPGGGRDACQGDSGGPLAINGRLAGIVSWGNGCARPGYPGAYTEVASYRDWISSKIDL